jgi:hypothetical protein
MQQKVNENRIEKHASHTAPKVFYEKNQNYGEIYPCDRWVITYKENLITGLGLCAVERSRCIDYMPIRLHLIQIPNYWEIKYWRIFIQNLKTLDI